MPSMSTRADACMHLKRGAMEDYTIMGGSLEMAEERLNKLLEKVGRLQRERAKLVQEIMELGEEVERKADDLEREVSIACMHAAFEDVIEDVVTAKEKYGNRIAVLGGPDVDFMSRATPDKVRSRVRNTLEKCHSDGGFCLGTGNSVPNFIPLENYLAMLDKGRKFV